MFCCTVCDRIPKIGLDFAWSVTGHAERSKVLRSKREDERHSDDRQLQPPDLEMNWDAISSHPSPHKDVPVRTQVSPRCETKRLAEVVRTPVNDRRRSLRPATGTRGRRQPGPSDGSRIGQGC